MSNEEALLTKEAVCARLGGIHVNTLNRLIGRGELPSVKVGRRGLIAEGFDVVFVSRQLGHKDPTVRLRVYADLFDRARHAEQARAAMEAAFGGRLSIEQPRPAANEDAPAAPPVGVSFSAG